MKCYNKDCLNEVDFEVTGSVYCSPECKSKCVAEVEAKRPVTYKFSDGSFFKRLNELKEEAKKQKAENFKSTLDVLTAPLI